MEYIQHMQQPQHATGTHIFVTKATKQIVLTGNNPHPTLKLHSRSLSTYIQNN